MTQIPRAFIFATLISVAGCISPAYYGPSPFERQPEWQAMQEMELVIMVENEYWRSVQVWVEWSNTRRHFLGDVDPGGREVFILPGELLVWHGQFRLVADPSDYSDRALTEPIEAWGFQRIEFTVRRVMGNSRVRVM